MSEAWPNISAVNFARREVLFEDGSIGELGGLLDIHGEETDDPDEVAAFVVGLNGWWSYVQTDVSKPWIWNTPS